MREVGGGGCSLLQIPFHSLLFVSRKFFWFFSVKRGGERKFSLFFSLSLFLVRGERKARGRRRRKGLGFSLLETMNVMRRLKSIASGRSSVSDPVSFLVFYFSVACLADEKRPRKMKFQAFCRMVLMGFFYI